MSDDTQEATVNFQEADTLRSLEQIMSGYDLPAVYNGILIGHWIDIANAVLQEYGEDSDGWRRMIWFSRIICNAISTSLSRNETEPLDGALKTFMTWLSVCNQEVSSLDLAMVASQHLGKRLVHQLAADVTEAGPDGAQSTLAMQAATLEPTPPSAPPSELRTAPDMQAGLASAMQAEPISEIRREPSLEIQSEPEIELQLEPISEPEPAMSTEAAVTSPEQREQPSNILTGSTMMDIPKMGESSYTQSHNESQIPASADSGAADRRQKRKSAEGPIPIGVWLGFHDEDVSTMAKLAVYDRANDNYIFANKQGFLVRELTTPQLLELIEDELIDIIERRAVTRPPAA